VPDIPAPQAPTPGGPGPKAQAALAEVRRHLGTPYQWGGSTPETGFDCSGLVQWAYAKAGVRIPRVTYDQIDAPGGEAVERGELAPGDLVFFQDESGSVYHVGMSLGGDRFIHAPRTGDVVKEASLDDAYFGARFAGGRRFDDATGAAPAAVPEAAPEAPAPAPAPAVDPAAVAAAEAAVARDAAETRRSDSILFKAVRAQESRNHGATVQFLTAIDPEQARRAAEATPAELREGAAAPAPAAAADPGPSPRLGEVPADYPGDDAGQAALAKWMAKQAEKAGLPPELPVMAALVESGVRNLDFGDADSVGFFQMRVGIWNRGAYAGYPDAPHLQVKWFIDQALAERERRVAAGRPIDDPRAFGEWIADVERPAAQYRGRYQLRLDEARRLLR
jgi:hypothetical protein